MNELTCQVHLEGFDGPLELLLNLVKEQQFDIATVPLASVAEQYLAYVADMDHLNIDTAADYLVIAATLGFLKSRSLLPPLPNELIDENEPSPEEVEERLRQRLIAYSQFRELAPLLRERADEASSFYWRGGGDPEADLQQHYALDARRLARALDRALSQAKPERRKIVRDRFTLAMQMEYVMRCLRHKGQVSFSSLIETYDRPGIIVTFLAILELVRQQRLTIMQTTYLDDLHLASYEVAQLSVN